MKSSVTQLVELAPALAAVLGADAVHTEDAQLDAYTADTYWPAISARANGTPLGRPDVVAIPRTRGRRGRRAARRRRPPRARRRLGRRVGHPGRRGAGARRPRHRPARARPDRRDRRALDDASRPRPASTATCSSAALNERGLMLPHYPASSEWATVGGYVAARGSGVLSTRYGKIEDLVLSLRVALAGGELIDTVARPAPRRRPRAHAALRRLGGHARDHHPRDARDRPAAGRAALRHAALPERRGRHRGLPVHAGRRLPAVRHPHVRRGGDRAARSRPSSARRWTASAPSSCFEGEPAAVAAGGVPHRRARARGGRARARPGARPALVGPPLRVLQAAAPPGAAVDLGHDRRRRAPTRNIVAVHEALQDRGPRPLRRRRASSCGCTSRTGTAGAR